MYRALYVGCYCFRGRSKKILKVYDVINCLNKKLIAHFVWYIEKEIGCDIETLSIDRELNREHFYEKIMQKKAPKASPRPCFNFAKLQAKKSFKPSSF